jgi:hypothetical protein
MVCGSIFDSAAFQLRYHRPDKRGSPAMSSVRQVRIWLSGIGLAAAAAMIGAVGAPVACADVIDDLLIQAEGDINNAGTLYSGIDASSLPALQAASIGAEASDLHNEAGLVSQIQVQQDALPEAVQSSSQLVSADNQLATASGDLLSAINAYVNAADAGDYVTGQGATLSGEVTGYFDRLDVVYAEVFQFLPATLNAEFTTLFDGFPNVEPISLPTEAAASASTAFAADGSVATDIGLLNSAQTDVTDALNVLGQVPGSTIQFPPVEFADIIGKFDAIQTPLLSSDNSLVSGLGEALFNGPDQQLAQSSDAFLAAIEAYAADPTSSTAELGALSATFQWGDSLLFDTLPANVVGGLIDKIFDLSPAADFASSVDPVSAVDPSAFADLLSSIGL